MCSWDREELQQIRQQTGYMCSNSPHLIAPCGLCALDGHNALLISFFDFGTVYVCIFALLSKLSHILFTSLFPCLSFPLRVDPLRFQAGCRKRRLYEALVFCVVVHFFWLVSACFSCVRFSFFSNTAMRLARGNISWMTYFVWSGT